MRNVLTSVWVLVVLAGASLAPAAGPGEGYEPLGKIAPRHAKEIEASNWSIGAETMDRDYTVYAHWRKYLGPLGVKKARLQSGWAKTESKRGEYDWAWMDEIIPDMVDQGVEPWVCLCYGNPIYPGGGGVGLGGGLIKSDEAMAAWLRYVDAFVRRYAKYVDEYEVWNEPGLRGKGGPKEYADLLIRTAEVIRARQPEAVILGMSTPGVGTGFTKAVLQVLKDKGKLKLLDVVTYHPYTSNPDASYGAVGGLRRTVRSFADHITIFQGENGCPSARGSFGALSGHDWSETSQAKWALRRLLGDLGRDIPSSYFAICEMAYQVSGRRDAGKKTGAIRVNLKGLLRIDPEDKTVVGVKEGYYALQHLAAVFDNTLTRVKEFEIETNAAKAPQAFAYDKAGGGRAVVLWFGDKTPGDSNECTPVTLTVSADRIENPVYADLRTGKVYAVPDGAWSVRDGKATFKDVPLYDSPVVLGDRRVIGSLAK